MSAYVGITVILGLIGGGCVGFALGMATRPRRKPTATHEWDIRNHGGTE